MTLLYGVLGGIAILVAGGVISGAWERIKKILFTNFGGLLLKFYTLGSKDLERNLFRYISMRPRKDASLLLVYLGLCCVVVGFCLEAVASRIDPHYLSILWVTGAAGILLMVGHPYLKVLYCEFYTMRFDYYMALARPYLSPAQRDRYNARFASLESKQQHMELCDEVKLVWKKTMFPEAVSTVDRDLRAQ